MYIDVERRVSYHTKIILKLPCVYMREYDSYAVQKNKKISYHIFFQQETYSYLNLENTFLYTQNYTLSVNTSYVLEKIFFFLLLLLSLCSFHLIEISNNYYL